jgi:uncharacterized protein YcfJ
MFATKKEKAMKTFTRSALALAAAALATQAAAQVTLYDRSDFQGRPVTTTQARTDTAFAASLIVMDNNNWEVCDETAFRGFCVTLTPGRYPSLASMGMRNPVSSVRVVDDPRAERREFRRRDGEHLFNVEVASVRAVMGSPEQRCWVERDQVAPRANVGGAIAGALIGGIVGHQIGRGGGRDVATVGGAVVGGAVGANVGRGSPGYEDVQRCATVPAQAPAFWEVTYFFQGQEHRVQMSTPPGPTITVNEWGEPRA